VPCSRRLFLESTLLATGSVAGLSLTGCPKHRAEPQDEEVVTGKSNSKPAFEPAYVKLERNGELAKREQQLWKMLEKCRCCPRKCEVNRLAGKSKICGATDQLRVSSAMPHFGEEPPLVGNRGSGTIFFSHCNLRCCFCQNWEIAHRGDGGDIGHQTLARSMLALQALGCHNINLVTPTHMVPHIIRALRFAIADGLRLPLVYNTGGYDSLEVVKLLDGIVDIYMPDFKFQDGANSYKYCSEARDYPEVAAAVIKEMHRQVGVLQTDSRGVATRGVILRHLVMPNNLAGTDRFVRWVAEELSPQTYVNLMDQYRPEHRAMEYPEIARRLTSSEWRQAQAWAKEAGLSNLDRG
jgi:putative pyruvate formate lyase activating enzyme